MNKEEGVYIQEIRCYPSVFQQGHLCKIDKLPHSQIHSTDTCTHLHLFNFYVHTEIVHFVFTKKNMTNHIHILNWLQPSALDMLL